MFGDPLSLFLLSQGAGAAASGLQNLTQKRGRWSQLSTLNPQQQQGQMQALQMALQGLQNPYQGFEPIGEQARTQFETQTIPGLAERFTNMGSGAQRSSAFQGALGAAGSQFEQGLAALRSQYGMQNRQLNQSLLSTGLQPNFENVYTAGGPSWLSSLFGGLSQGAQTAGLGAMGQYMNQPIASAIQNKAPNNINQTLSFIQQRQAQQARNPQDSMMAMRPDEVGTSYGAVQPGQKWTPYGTSLNRPF